MKTKSKFAVIASVLLFALLLPAGYSFSDTNKETVKDVIEKNNIEEATIKAENHTQTSIVEVEDKEDIYLEIVEKENVGLAEVPFDTPGFICNFVEKAVSYTSTVVNIYKIADEGSEIVGVMQNLNEVGIIQIEDEWTYVSFKGIEGYVKNAQVLFGKEAEYIASQYGTKKTIFANKLTNVYEDADDLSPLIAKVKSDTNVYILEDNDDGYLYIQYGEDAGYVKASDIKDTYDLPEALTIDEYNQYLKKIAEEEERKRKEEEEARLAAERAQAVQAGMDKYIPTEQGAAFNFSEEELWLLACIVKYESGWQPYEGKLAVANVVLNRIKAGYGDITSVIYARYQFSGVSDNNGGPSDYFKDNYLTQPLNYRLPDAHADECMKAAIEAASGINNIGSFRFFIGNGAAEYGSYSDYKIIGGHTFYNY